MGDSNEKTKRGGLEGLLGGLTNLIEKLGELAEKGEELSRLREGRGEGEGVNVVYGVSVKAAPGRPSWKVEPFGNVRRDPAGRSVVEEAREPLIDVFDEAEETVIVAELPGVGLEDIRLRAEGDLLVLTAESAGRKYRKEIRLSGAVREEAITISYRNGIAEIRCPRG
ncbi:MAG: Hsp20/alpha crystallin family protein [Deltaproteobacteria bacterium]|nr:Hsp20/alpha crystallin family protein [Deltaproteobacteria bacterium]